MTESKSEETKKELIDPRAVWERLATLIIDKYKTSESLMEQYAHGESPSEGRTWALTRERLEKLDSGEQARRLAVLLDSFGLAVAVLIAENNERLLRLLSGETETK